MYSVDDKKITHQLFVKNGIGKFHEVGNVKVAVPYITPYQIDFYLENYVLADTQNRSEIFISGDFANTVWRNAKKYKRTPLRYEIRRSKGLSLPNDPLNHCGGDIYCPVGSQKSCAIIAGQRKCEANMCAAAEMAYIMKNENIEESNHFNLDLMYAFRNDFTRSI